MGDFQFISLSRRVERIERENRQLKLVCFWMFLALPATLLVMGGANFQDRVFGELEVRKLALKDQDGKVALLLETDKSGLPTMKMLDHKGQVRIKIGIEDIFGARQILSDKNGKMRVDLSVNEFGASTLQFLGDEGGAQMALAVSHVAPINSRILFSDSKDQARMTLGLMDTDPSIVMTNENNTDRINFGLFQDEAQLEFRDQNESSRMSIRGEKDGEVFIRFRDEQEKPLLILPGGLDVKK